VLVHLEKTDPAAHPPSAWHFHARKLSPTSQVLPGEETVPWQSQHVHQKKRQVAASRALGRLARWLASQSAEASGARQRCVDDPRFARIAAAAALPSTASEAGAGADADANQDVLLESLRALGSLAPLPLPPPLSADVALPMANSDRQSTMHDGGDEREHGHDSVLEQRPHRRIAADAAAQLAARVVSWPGGIARQPAATAGAWAAARLNLVASDSPSASKTASALILATAGLPFKVLPVSSGSGFGCGSLSDRRGGGGGPKGGGGTHTEDHPAASLAHVTVAALVAEVPFKAEQLVTRDGKRVDERRETCWMAEEGVVGGRALASRRCFRQPLASHIVETARWWHGVSHLPRTSLKLQGGDMHGAIAVLSRVRYVSDWRM
jgi:hypothetical protein